MEAQEFNRIYAEYKNKVTAYVYNKVGDRSMVEDLVEDVFVKVYQHLDSYDETKSSLSSWIYTLPYGDGLLPFQKSA